MIYWLFYLCYASLALACIGAGALLYALFFGRFFRPLGSAPSPSVFPVLFSKSEPVAPARVSVFFVVSFAVILFFLSIPLIHALFEGGGGLTAVGILSVLCELAALLYLLRKGVFE